MGTLDYTQRWALAAFTPLMLMLPFAGPKLIRASEQTQQRAARTVTYLASFFFLWAVEACMEVWACTEAEEGNSYLDAAPEIQCKAGNPSFDWLLAGSVILFMVYFFGIQGGLFLVALSDDEGLKRGLVGEYREGCELWFLAINIYKWLVSEKIRHLSHKCTFKTNSSGVCVR